MNDYFNIKNMIKKHIRNDATIDNIELEYNRDEIEKRMRDKIFTSVNHLLGKVLSEAIDELIEEAEEE